MCVECAEDQIKLKKEKRRKGEKEKRRRERICMCVCVCVCVCVYVVGKPTRASLIPLLLSLTHTRMTRLNVFADGATLLACIACSTFRAKAPRKQKSYFFFFKKKISS